MSYFSADDLHHFNEGTATRLHDRLGAHPAEVAGDSGTHFSVWAPGAKSVTVIGDFNGWTSEGVTLQPVQSSGIWHAFAQGIEAGALYKFRIVDQDDQVCEKADPLGFAHEAPPKTASVVTKLDYRWSDAQWMGHRKKRNALDAPISVYELHIGSWKRHDDHSYLSYRELAPLLVEYVKDLGFTHVELMPVTEHPFYGSWGYQVTGYFAATSRYGSPQDLMFLIDSLHQADIGVILDIVPAHFPTDEHGLGNFDGSHLYEHSDPRCGFHPDWNTYIFNYGRYEVRSFLISSAIFWLEHYHVDALRVDGVASMLYLDYSREPGEWIPNEHGGRENLAAITYLQQFNTAVYREFPDVQTIAEESTSFPQVSRPVDHGGLGFGLKWDMGWMHDTLEYFKREPVHRRHHQNDLTFRGLWAFSENFALPLSHDEVVHGKGSLLTRMPGDEWQKFANLRLLFAHMFGTPGKKLIFMGGEFGQWGEWDHEGQLSWNALDYGPHRGVQHLVRRLNALYVERPELHELDCEERGFEWLHTEDTENSVLSYARKSDAGDVTIIVLNLTPVPRDGYRLGVPCAGTYELSLDSDAAEFGGSGYRKSTTLPTDDIEWQGRSNSIVIDIPPLSAGFWTLRRD